MRLTPRAEALRPQVRSLVEEATRVLAPPAPLDPRLLQRTFTLFATDHALLVLGPALNRMLTAAAPQVSLRVLPSVADDWTQLRDGMADLSICLPGAFPPEFRTQLLFHEKFVCVMRRGHPLARKRLTLARYLAADHVVVAPLGRPSQVDQILEARGQSRRIRHVVPYVATALHLAATSDHLLTVSENAARAMSRMLPLVLREPPVHLARYGVHLLWHPRLDNEPANQWMRGLILQAARQTTKGVVSTAKRAKR
jgi:DNA-binding transcriptional LysR family regulator